MPTYDYQCSRCGHRFEELQSMTDPHLEVCPECGGPLKRLIGAGAGLLFKGSGFYITDHRSKEYRKKAGAESGSPPADKKPAPSDPKPGPSGSSTGPPGGAGPGEG